MYYSYVYPDYLAHYGVQGMKWGQHLMAKYETNRAGRALKRTITNKKDSGKYERAQKTLRKYEGEYSKADIAASAQRSARRANTVTKVVNTIGQVAGAISGGSSVVTGLGAAAMAVAAPTYGAYAAVALGTAAYSAAVSGGTYAFASAAKRNSNTSYKYVVSELEKYSKS